MRQLHQLDVNLLVALELLLRERHVTRAAARLGVTQSAMSQTLARLRGVFDDPLLVRSGASMVPTPRAAALEGPLRDALRTLERVVAEMPDFDPATASRRFRLAMFDHATVTLLPRLVARVQQAAPGVDLEVVPMDVERIAAQLRNEEVDAAILLPRESVGDIAQRPLFRDELASMVRKDHPLAAAGPKTLEEFAAWPHATIRLTEQGRGSLDEALSAAGVDRRVSLRVPYFLAAPALVERTDYVISLPRSMAVAFAAHWPLAIFAPPLEAPHRFTVHLLWSRTLDADPAQRWLRDQVLAAAEEVPGMVCGPAALEAEA